MNTYAAPRSRHEGIVVEEIGDEVLIYDTVRETAHNLNRTAALVWKLCDGSRNVDELARLVGRQLGQPFSRESVWYTLGKLEEYNLLETPVAVPPTIASLSRREFLTKFAVAAAVVPVVKTLKVPTAPTAASCQGSGQSCAGALCCSGLTCCGGTICAPTGTCSG